MMTGRSDPNDDAATTDGRDGIPEPSRDEEEKPVAQSQSTRQNEESTPLHRSLYTSARDRMLLRLRPRWFTVLSLSLALAAPRVSAGQATFSLPAVAGSVLLSAGYWYWRPSHYQLRHRLSEDILVVPFKDSGDSNGDPAGSSRAAEFETDRSMLVFGETGSGKTEAIKLLAHQMQADPDEAFVIFDYKEDYQTFFADDDLLRLSSRDSDVTWNVFCELKNREDCDEIAEAVFAGTENNYFTNAATQVFADILRFLYQRGYRHDYTPTNKDLVDFLADTDAEDLRKFLEEENLSSKKHIPKGAEASLNIVSNLEERVNKVFTGDFAEHGYFSIRDYMNDPEGKKLVLDFPIERSSSVQPMFRLFIDWSIRFGLTTERGSYYVLDEFAALPELDMIERLINAGRAYNCYAIMGVQAISQLHERYGNDSADSLLSGLAQEIHLRVGDQASVKYWRQRIGRERVERGDGDNKRVTEEYPIGENTIQNLEAGRGIVHTIEGWQRGRLYMLEEVEDRLLANVGDTR
jgi:energy-coupling factor transporter ATP-binding protein EcfA2